MTLTKNARRFAAGFIAAAALPVAALAGAGNAQAAVLAGCTINPLTPNLAFIDAAGVKVLDYRITVNCAAGRHAHITQQVYEADAWPNPDDLIVTRNFIASGVTVLHNQVALPNTEVGSEEMYQRVRFWVHGDNGAVSATTPWQNSVVLTIAN